MSRTNTLIAALSAAILAAPAMAQEQGATAEQEEQPAGQLLDMGQPADDGPKVGDRYSKEKFGDWDLACIKVNQGEDPCSLLQILKDDKGNPMAEFSLFRLKEGGQAVAAATVIVPLETLLPAQLTISIDGAPGKRYQYSFCNPIGCIAQIGLTQADVDAMKNGKEAIVSLVPAPAPTQVIKLKASLKGFTAGYDKVDVVENR